MKQTGWPQRRVLWMWSAVVLVSALSAAAGSPLDRRLPGSKIGNLSAIVTG
jgi:hypothetical protein